MTKADKTTMTERCELRSGIGKLEVILLLAAATLVFQLFPSIWSALWSALDFRAWSRTGWIFANIAVVLMLVGVRFVPDLHAEWKRYRENQAQERSKAEKANALREQRETLERIKRGWSRRVW